jgi:hypothetical protein
VPEPYYKPNGYSTDKLIDSLDDNALLAHMGVPARYWAMVASPRPDRDPRIGQWLLDFKYIYRPSVDMMLKQPKYPGLGLLLHGASGTGKTSIASRLLLELVRSKVENSDPSGQNFTWHGSAMGLFVDWQDVSESFRMAASKDDLHAVKADEFRMKMRPTGPMNTRGDILVIDDISRERRTEFNSGELHRILRRRYDNCYPTIITTNHNPDEWDDVYGDVMASFLTRAFLSVEI